MISTQRLLIMVISLNLLMGTLAELFMEPTQFPTNQLTTEAQFAKDYENEFESDSGIWASIKSTTTNIWEGTIGNPIKWGYTILRIFVRSALPLPFNESMFETQQEKYIAEGFNWFIHILQIVLIIEAYMVFKNKKTS